MGTTIFERVAELGLPLGQYAVIGSGVMAAHGIRDFKDIDLLVTPELYEELKQKGWQEKAVRPDFIVIEKGMAEASPGIMTLPTYRPDISKLIAEADIINGIPFVKLEEVIAFKRAMGREKDFKDIELIENYLGAKRVIIVHQWMAGAEGDWRPWLKKELERQGYEVALPHMPDIDTPVIEKWVAKIAEVVGKPDADTYFVGHSIGCQAILRYLETIDAEVGGAVFVAGWFDLENLEDEETAGIARPWIETPIDLEKVKSALPASTLIISDNDPYGAFEENKKKFAELGSKLVVLHGAGHITAEHGFTKLPEIITELKNLVTA